MEANSLPNSRLSRRAVFAGAAGIVGLATVTDPAVVGAMFSQGEEMSELTHRMIETNGIEMHIAELGAGPLVLMLHGFPESWYSWRHQL